jgi:hypothetical protein
MASTEKISITLGREQLKSAKRLASELGLSLSTFVNDAVRQRVEAEARTLAGLEVIASFPPEERATPEEMRALMDKWSESPAPRATVRAKRSRSRRSGR